MKFEDILYKKDIKTITVFFDNINNSNNSNVLVIKGCIGCGKTTICNLIEQKYIDKFKFFTYDIDYNNNKNTIQNTIKHKNILSLFKQKTIVNGIILDNIKNVTSFLKLIVRYKKKYYHYPIIIVIDTEFNEKLFNFKYTKIEIKPKKLSQLINIYKNYKINKKILNSVLKKSFGDFNYINTTLLFIKLSPKIALNDIKNLNKDVNLNNYFLLLKFINSKKIILEEYDYNFLVYLFKNIYNIINLININFYLKKKYISYIYKNAMYINEGELKNIFLIGVKYILNLNNIRNIKYVNTVSKSLLLNNNIRSINKNVLLKKEEDLTNNIYLHNIIKKNNNNKYDKFQKFINFEYI